MDAKPFIELNKMSFCFLFLHSMIWLAGIPKYKTMSSIIKAIFVPKNFVRKQSLLMFESLKN